MAAFHNNDGDLSGRKIEPGNDRRAGPSPSSPADEDRLVTDGELERALSRSLREVLDLKNWDENAGLEKLATAVPRFVASSVENDRRYREIIRAEIFRCLHTFADAPKHAGVYTVH